MCPPFSTLFLPTFPTFCIFCSPLAWPDGFKNVITAFHAPCIAYFPQPTNNRKLRWGKRGKADIIDSAFFWLNQFLYKTFLYSFDLSTAAAATAAECGKIIKNIVQKVWRTHHHHLYKEFAEKMERTATWLPPLVKMQIIYNYLRFEQLTRKAFGEIKGFCSRFGFLILFIIKINNTKKIKLHSWPDNHKLIISF